VEESEEKRPMIGANAGARARVVIRPDDRRSAVIDTIDSSREHLSLSIFRCDDDGVVDALTAAVRRGVHVRVLLTSRAKASKAHLKQLHAVLTAAGAEVRRYTDAVVRYHAKYIVADAATAVIASFNFTRKCFHTTCDFAVVTHDSQVIAAVTHLFDGDWRGNAYDAVADGADQLIVGPEQARRRFAELFESATERIRIIDPKIDDPAMLTLLKRRAAAGLRVEIRGPTTLGSLVPHGKLLVIDDSLAVIGSISLSMLALEFRRELAVVTRDRASLATLDQFWQSLPALATAGDAPGVSGDPFLPA
jgi:phosphatidylserine/phosphatidylglycerophosphate/cardiolipin synthase-like enzyme